jgi:uncharacterized protein YdhG (YjbR/CyaY superfamily)
MMKAHVFCNNCCLLHRTLPDDRKAALKKLRRVIKKNLPKGFKEVLNYNLPLPFLAFASQKNFVALYHMGLYADDKLLAWFQKQWPKHVKTKLDMGKSCIRFKKVEPSLTNSLANSWRK